MLQKKGKNPLPEQGMIVSGTYSAGTAGTSVHCR